MTAQTDVKAAVMLIKNILPATSKCEKVDFQAVEQLSQRMKIQPTTPHSTLRINLSN